MGIMTKIMNPVFALITLDILTRQIDALLLNPTIGFKIPVAARAAMSLTFNLIRLKVSGRFTKGLPFGLGTMANFAIRLSGLQIALNSLPVFFDPKNYEVIGSSPDYGVAPSALPSPYQPSGGGVQAYSFAPSGAFNIGDYVRVTTGVDTGRTGTIQSFDGSRYTVSGIMNSFFASEITRV